MRTVCYAIAVCSWIAVPVAIYALVWWSLGHPLVHGLLAFALELPGLWFATWFYLQAAMKFVDWTLRLADGA